jgi:hypothetical protein
MTRRQVAENVKEFVPGVKVKKSLRTTLKERCQRQDATLFGESEIWQTSSYKFLLRRMCGLGENVPPKVPMIPHYAANPELSTLSGTKGMCN